MKRAQVIALGLATAVVACSLVALAGVTVKSEKENVVASRLIGKWKTHTTLSKRLRGNAVREETIEFSGDASVAAKVPDSLFCANRIEKMNMRADKAGGVWS